MTSITGLSRADVRERRDRGEINTLPNDTGRSLWRILQANLFTLFNAIVGGSFLVLLVLGYWQDALFGFFVIANVAIGVAQEFRAKVTLSRLAVLNAPRARVLRRASADGDGEVAEVAIADVVLDDVLALSAGDQVVADAVVLEASGLDVDESLLTGEADPVPSPAGRELLSGSTVVGGSGLARVIRVGADSYASRITAEAKQFSLVGSELRDSIARIIRWISIGLLPVGAIVVNGQMQAVGGWEVALSSGAWREAVVAATASIIAMVPQGLVFMTSVALAVGAVKLSRREVLVQELAAVEGLARVDMLCLDKTGTLTEGGLALDGVEDAPGAASGEALRAARDAALACFADDRDANATARALGERFGARGGSASASAVDPALAPSAPSVAALPAIVARVPFSSLRKWSAAQLADPAGSWLLGAPDIVLARVDGSAGDGVAVDATLTRCRELAASGLRTLVLARSSAPLTTAAGDGADEHGVIEAREAALPAGLEPVAVVTFRERVRGDAHETLQYFREQGVSIRIISGDDPRTVAAVAREAGVDHVGDGFDARQLPEGVAALDDVMGREHVFGRVSPEQKKAMVKSLQRLGYTVAMTGDGVNDALALKHADLGIAMGSGAPATRAVARLVLLDGQFSRLPRIVAEGRQVIANVERLAKLFLSKTVYAILFAVVFGALLWPFPFLPRQLSIVDGLTIGLPAIVLALLPNARVYRPGFLRRAARFCIPSGVLVAATVIGVVAYAYAVVDAPADEVQTTAVITLTLSALWVLVILARPLSRVTLPIVLAAYAGLVVVLSIPIAVDFLQLASPPPTGLLVVAVGASAACSLALEVLHRLIARATR
ncbi:HAD-IC family P-type ATPase [Yonghaparkia sp. Soil809]|uniref:HAD-IC family P-type ATPase n=1 Tax=Yonghaparkia sp. Soil809 TaxID=1736417 RepID=UPI0006F9A698|nr:HAD-IC family P-type ATPase [Yonghaparkia sp. Soil809]KRF33375.1 ATPase [Yonghaparkia sp. Soil809]